MLNIDLEFKKGIMFARVSGIVNGDTISYFNDNLTNIIKDNGIIYLLVNLKEVKYMDKYGINMLIELYEYINNKNGKMIICGINRLFNYNLTLFDNLYSINKESDALEVINI